MGKVLAMLVVVVFEISCLVIGALISNYITVNILFPGGTSILANVSGNILSNINPLNIISAIIVILLGLIFYAILAGLAGATVSRMEEASEGLTLFTLASIGGAYIGMGAANSLMSIGENPFATFALLFPLSSPFLIPGTILVGKTSIHLIVIAVLILLASIMLLFRFVANVYETIILDNGNKISVKKLFQISKNNKRSKEVYKKVITSKGVNGGGAQGE